MFYLGEDLNIVNNVYSCDNSTGRFHRENTYIMQMAHSSEDIGLAVVLLDGEDPAYKLSYSDHHNHIYQATGDSQGWNFAGVVSQDSNLTGRILGAAGAVSGSGGTFSVVVSPRDHNIEVMDSDGADDWHISRLTIFRLLENTEDSQSWRDSDIPEITPQTPQSRRFARKLRLFQ